MVAIKSNQIEKEHYCCYCYAAESPPHIPVPGRKDSPASTRAVRFDLIIILIYFVMKTVKPSTIEQSVIFSFFRDRAVSYC